MTTITQYMSGDHHRCDELYAVAEASVEEGDWTLAEAHHQRFLEAMQHHFAMEEDTLFPAFEVASGSPSGPTTVMRHEHEQMRKLFEEMTHALAAHHGDDYLGSAETLLILMQQHNAKEEQILYPMSDRLLAARQESVLQQMQQGGEA